MILEIIRDDGQKLIAGDYPNKWLLLNKQGTSNVEVEQYLEPKGLGFGDYYAGSRVKSRELVYRLQYLGDLYEGRFIGSTFFDVNRSYTIKSTIQGSTLLLDVKVLSIVDTQDLYHRYEVEIRLIAQDPYWRAESPVKLSTTNVTQQWHYPYAFTNQKKDKLYVNAYEQIEIQNELVFEIDSNIITDFRITIKGTIENLVLTLNDTQICTISGSLGQGVLVMDFKKGIYSFNGENIIAQISLQGQMILRQGINRITTSEPCELSIEYDKKYAGDVLL